MNGPPVLRWAHTRLRRLLPLGLRSDRDYFFFTFVILGSFFLLLLSPWLYYLGRLEAGWSSLLCAVALLVIGLLWLRGLSLKWAHLAYQTVLMTTVLFNVVVDGGVSSPMMAWLSIVPLLPLFTLSRAWAAFWLALAFVSVLSVCLAQTQGWLPVVRQETNNELITSATMYALLCITQLMLILTYDSVSVSAMRKVARQNRLLQNLSGELRQANAHKDRFLSTVTHELRTPLNAVMGYLGLILGERGRSEEVLDQAQHAQAASEHLLSVINDLLDYSQIQQGRLVLTPQVVDIRKTLMSAHQSMQPRADDKALSYRMILSERVTTFMCLDPHRLKQILVNLLGNAIKFTDKGGVMLAVDFIVDAENSSAGQLVLTVSDTGHGVPENEIRRIFEPFVQLLNPMSSSSINALKGNGLGLSIARSLVLSWHGKIDVKSTLGCGTEFTVRLPVTGVHDAPFEHLRTAPHTFPENMNLLLVDDHQINRMVARATILRTLPNALIDETVNGAEAFQKMSEKLYDLVLMDLVMPDFSGIEVVSKIRSETSKPYCDVNVVAFTANVSEDTVKSCRAVGMKSMLPKPFNTDVLINTIRQHAT